MIPTNSALIRNKLNIFHLHVLVCGDGAGAVRGRYGGGAGEYRMESYYLLILRYLTALAYANKNPTSIQSIRYKVFIDLKL